MPQKRNPDALELVRGVGKALTQAPAQAYGLVAGLGLGYQRDLQATKPLQAQTLRDAGRTLGVLLEVVQGMTFDAGVLADALRAPGVTATDMAEALVAHGKPFRAAYTALAEAFHAVEDGTPLAAALATVLDPDEAEVALTAAEPDPARRDTLAGPAPVRVQQAVADLRAILATQAGDVQAADAAVEVPAALLSTQPALLLGVVTA